MAGRKTSISNLLFLGLISCSHPLSADRHPHDPDGCGDGDRRHLPPCEGLVDRADLRAVPALDRVHQRHAIVGIDGGVGLGAGDGDIGDAGIDVAAERLQMRHHPVAGRALRGMNGLDPAGADVAVSDVGHVEGPTLAGLVADDEQALVGVDRDHLCGAAVDPLGGMVVAGELNAVAGAKLLGGLGIGLGLVRAALGGVPGDGLVRGVEQPQRVGAGVDGIDPVGGVATQASVVVVLAEQDDGAKAVAGGAGALGVGMAMMRRRGWRR